MGNLTKEEVVAFCNHCDWSFQCWSIARHLFEDNPNEKYLRHPHHIHLFAQLSKILHEYWIHEVTKLSDPSKQHGNNNLSIDFVFETGAWPEATLSKHGRLRPELKQFSDKLREARNKLLSHKDLNTILSGKTLGEFQEHEDVVYFSRLAEFASITYEHFTGNGYLFDDLTKNDIEIFMSTFIHGCLGEDE